VSAIANPGDAAPQQPDPAELEAIRTAYLASASFADVLTRATKFAGDIQALVDLTPSMGVSTADAMALCARELQFAAVLGRSGMFRPAFGAVRLALEAVSWGVYLSTDEIASRRWLSNIEDLKWSSSVSGDRGALTEAFATIFFPSLSVFSNSYLTRAQTLYRDLSGFVHGEVRTHALTLAIEFNPELMQRLKDASQELVEIALFMYTVRFLDGLSRIDRVSEDALVETLGHLEPMRTRLETLERN